jgi:hypothetical protein
MIHQPFTSRTPGGAQPLQPGHLRFEIVGMDVQVHPAGTLVHLLRQQPERITEEHDPWYAGKRLLGINGRPIAPC